MNGQMVYSIFLGIRNHFTNAKYDYATYGPARTSAESIGRYYVLLNGVAGKFDSKEALETHLVATFKHKTVWIDEVMGADAKQRTIHHEKDVKNWRSNLQIDLGNIVNMTGDVLTACRCRNPLEVPPIGRLILNNSIKVETYVCLDMLLGFNDKIGDLIWKEQKIRYRKYRTFFQPRIKDVANVARPFFGS